MTWVKRWGREVRPTTAPGVMRTKDGRYLVHGKVSESGRKRVVSRVVEAPSVRAAQSARLDLLAETKATSTHASRPLFAEYAQSLFARKVAQRDLKSAKTRERWDTTLRLHLVPAFGRFPVDAIRKLEVEAWKTRISKRIARGKGSPRTANGWLSILRVVLRSAVDDFELERDPTLRVKDFPTSEHPTYTAEDPNSLTPAQATAFLATLRVLFPQFFAMVLLGFATGLRPSTLRPLRRRGDEPDVLWSESAILIRRSNALAQEVMNTTKTNNCYRLGLPPDVMTELETHRVLLRGKRKRSDLLFPSKRGRLMSRSALDKPFAVVSKAIGLPFTLTPRGMRRTYQDLARLAGIDKEVKKAICGHEDDDSTERYSTIRAEEMARAIAKFSSTLLPPAEPTPAASSAA